MCHRGRRANGGFYSGQRALRNATQLQEKRSDGRTRQWQVDVSY
jgi:hypothetical protein